MERLGRPRHQADRSAAAPPSCELGSCERDHERVVGRADHRRAVLAREVGEQPADREGRDAVEPRRRLVGDEDDGPAAIARASATRSRSPAESASTGRSARSARPTMASASIARSRASTPSTPRSARRELDVLARGVRRPRAPASARRPRCGRGGTLPAPRGRAPRARRRRSTISPSSGVSSPASSARSVDFPEPDGPVTAVSIARARTAASRCSSATSRPVAPAHAAGLDDRAGRRQRSLDGSVDDRGARRRGRAQLDDASADADDARGRRCRRREATPRGHAASRRGRSRSSRRRRGAPRRPGRRARGRRGRRSAGGRVMADDQRRRALLTRELAKQVEHARARSTSSSSPVGSSATSSVGRCASAAQRAIRCCSPPESSPGVSVGAVEQPHPLEQLVAPGGRARRAGTPRRPSGSATSSSAVRSAESARQ